MSTSFAGDAIRISRESEIHETRSKSRVVNVSHAVMNIRAKGIGENLAAERRFSGSSIRLAEQYE